MTFIKYNKAWFKNNTEEFDLVFSQEVLYTIRDLEEHAKEMFNILKPDGYYFATMGSHIPNPLWSLRRDIIARTF